MKNIPLARWASRPALLAFFIVLTIFFFRSSHVNAFISLIGDSYIYNIYVKISEFVNENTRDFIIFLAASIYMESVKGRTYSLSDDDLSQVAHKVSRELDCIDVNEALESSLKRKFQIDRRLNIENLLFRKKPLEDVKIDIKLADDAGSKYHFIYTFKMTMRASGRDFIFALARSRSVQDRLCEFPLISDVQVVPYSLQDENMIKLTLRDIVVGCVPHAELKLERVAKSKWSHYTPNLKDVYEKDYILFKLSIPEASSRFFYELKNMRMSKFDHYIFWIADRLTYLEEITIDASSMTYEGPISYSFATNILGYHAEDLDKPQSDGIYKVRAYQWLTYGQGITLAWRKRNENTASDSQQPSR